MRSVSAQVQFGLADCEILVSVPVQFGLADCEISLCTSAVWSG